MRLIHQTSSRTAAPMYGHRGYIGQGSAVTGQVTPGLIERVRAEKARRAFYAASECDRLPMGLGR
ncbi:hypothetical protein [Novosphingobium sp.]|uniref:hypothetical protein n=1 Tax=Novosphingobium sp. TaxID=1874826 RepID=UPI00286DF4CB|nr:hypothetical protein [Novosphingobium sp.]